MKEFKTDFIILLTLRVNMEQEGILVIGENERERILNLV